MKIQAKIERVLQSGKLKAIASVSLDGMFVVKGLKVMDGQSDFLEKRCRCVGSSTFSFNWCTEELFGLRETGIMEQRL